MLESLFNKITNLIIKRLQHRYFPVKFLRTPFSTEHLRWLLLKPMPLIHLVELQDEVKVYKSRVSKSMGIKNALVLMLGYYCTDSWLILNQFNFPTLNLLTKLIRLNIVALFNLINVNRRKVLKCLSCHFRA